MPQELLKQAQPEKHKQSPERSQREKLKQPQRSGSFKSPRSGQNRTVQIRLQSCPRIRDQEPSTSGHKDVSREVSNSSNYSEMTSVDGMISPNPRAKRNPPLEEERPSASPISKDQTISNKLAATLSPMIKRKVISAMQSVQANQNTLPPPKSNMYLAFITLFICPPLGCLAWHHARKVNKLMADDMTRARLASKMAATYSYIGFLIGGLILTAIFVAYVLVDALQGENFDTFVNLIESQCLTFKSETSKIWNQLHVGIRQNVTVMAMRSRYFNQDQRSSSKVCRILQSA